uniref:Uncharacterized protein n=1 Tax=Setaria italica TaxID=4555 RepID=K3YNJ7_SETIT
MWIHPLKAVTCRFQGIPPNKTGLVADTPLSLYTVVARSPLAGSVVCTLAAS